MPRPNKGYSEVLYAHVRPENKSWVDEQTRLQGNSISDFINMLLDRARLESAKVQFPAPAPTGVELKSHVEEGAFTTSLVESRHNSDIIPWDFKPRHKWLPLSWKSQHD